MLTKIQKYLQGEATEKEIQEIEIWIHLNPDNLDIFKEQVRLSNYTNLHEKPDIDTAKAFRKVSDTLSNEKSKSFHIRYKWYAVAAAFFIVISSVLFWKFSKDKTPIITSNTIVASETKRKSANDIRLTLPDGTLKVLQENEDESIKDKNGNIIGQQKQNVISFNFPNNSKSEKLLYNELEVPKGKIFALILSDGSKVWLNAESTFRFPQKFLGSVTTRSVELKGEAYFEVAKNTKRPFVVITEQSKITVLGTKFNISSYIEDQKSSTTLVEGSVLVSAAKSRTTTTLSPGYQVVVRHDSEKILPKKVNASDHIAWIENRLLFENETFAEITKKIERSYDVIIHNEYEDLNDKRFTGEFDVEDIESILTTFSMSKPFDFSIKNDSITIKKRT